MAVTTSKSAPPGRLPARLASHPVTTPTSRQRGGRTMHIRYTTLDTPLGHLLVVATESGICRIAMGEDDTALESVLAKEYPDAEHVRDDRKLHPFTKQIVAHLCGRLRDFDLPLDIDGTPFQQRVWRALQQIPYGHTRTYQEIAHAVGKPQAVRAVGAACGANPVVVVVPCHRVVRSDGSLGGFGWGLDVKRQLLALEQAIDRGGAPTSARSTSKA